MKEKKHFSLLLLIFRLFSIAIILVCLYEIYLWNEENKANKSLSSKINSEYVDGVITLTLTNEEENSDGPSYEFPNVNFEDLTETNKHTTAWVRVNNTNIDFPIVQYTDNSYYLTHNFKNDYNKAGWIFADFRNNLEDLDTNTIIYGHNRRNGTMFSNLQYFLNESWYEDPNNTYFLFETKSTKYIAEIFSVYKAVGDTLEINNKFETEDDYKEYLRVINSFTIHDFGVETTTNDKIITLFTCDNNVKNRILIHAKLVEIE